MAKFRRAARCDENQPGIVEALRNIPGVTVSVNHDDILCGRNGKTYWFEIKDPAKAVTKDGKLKSGALKDSQVELLETWSGHYSVVWSLDQILKEIGVERN